MRDYVPFMRREKKLQETANALARISKEVWNLKKRMLEMIFNSVTNFLRLTILNFSIMLQMHTYVSHDVKKTQKFW